MSDLAHDLTDTEIAELEKRLKALFKQAGTDMDAKLADYLEAYRRKDDAMRQSVEDGIIKESDWQAWRANQMLGSVWNRRMSKQFAESYLAANRTAADYLNAIMPSVYAMNANYAAYRIEMAMGGGQSVGMGVSFDLYDRDTVLRLAKDDPQLLPKRRVDVPKDLRWNQKAMTNSLMQGIIQGESIGELARRFQSVTDMNLTSAIRNARTAITGAENAGRMDTYKRAAQMGIRLKKEWMATLDGRTRHEHRLLDGQAVELDEPFKVDGMKIEFPGDPKAKAKLVYNCRCTLVAKLDGVRDDQPRTTYTEWEEQKKAGALEKDALPLTFYEKSALLRYGGGESYAINEALRNGAGISEEQEKLIKHLDSAIMKLPVYEGQVQRSISLSGVELEQFLTKHSTGRVVRYPAFTSASTSVYDSNMNVQLHITGRNGRDTRFYKTKEDEILFPRKSRFVVVKREGCEIWMKEV